jgi:hypothetical protein
MKNRSLKLVAAFVIILAASCNEPETTVTNIVHADGSVTRKVEMRNSSNKFEFSSLQVPVDSSWTITDSVEIGEKGDTVWVRKAEKLFRNIDEINLSYKRDSSYNRKFVRHTEFEKKFRWFSTVYRFSETIDKRMARAYPLRDFLNDEELAWYYSPGYWNGTDILGADSLKFKILADSISDREEQWYMRSLVSEWIHEFDTLLKNRNEDSVLIADLLSGENKMVEIVSGNETYFDSLWSSGFILREFLGDSLGLKYQAEADSAIDLAVNRFMESFKEYNFRISMPGRITGSNGFADSSSVMIWPVRSEFFLAEPYEMWAVSRITHPWAWIVSALFILFVITGIIVKTKKEG